MIAWGKDKSFLSQRTMAAIGIGGCLFACDDMLPEITFSQNTSPVRTEGIVALHLLDVVVIVACWAAMMAATCILASRLGARNPSHKDANVQASDSVSFAETTREVSFLGGGSIDFDEDDFGSEDYGTNPPAMQSASVSRDEADEDETGQGQFPELRTLSFLAGSSHIPVDRKIPSADVVDSVGALEASQLATEQDASDESKQSPPSCSLLESIADLRASGSTDEVVSARERLGDDAPEDSAGKEGAANIHADASDGSSPK